MRDSGGQGKPMREPNNIPVLARLENLETSLLSLLQEIRSVKAEIQAADQNGQQGDRLLTAESESIGKGIRLAKGV